MKSIQKLAHYTVIPTIILIFYLAYVFARWVIRNIKIMLGMNST